MKVVKMIFMILLGIIRLPFTIWYIVAGLIFKILGFVVLFCTLVLNASKNDIVPEETELIVAIVTFEWASLLKFYHFKW